MSKREREDPLDEVRRMKLRASEPFQHDVEKYGAFLMECQEKLAKAHAPLDGKRAERPAA